MKKLTLLFTVLLIGIYLNAQNVAINNDGTSAAGSAMLDVKSTTKGFLMPRMTSAERISVSSPVLGLLVFDTDTKSIWAYNGTSWSNLTTAGGGSLSLPFDQTANLSIPAFRIENNGSGDVMQLGSLGNATGLNLYTTNGVGIHVNTTNNIGIRATSWSSNAIHAFTNNPNNNIPTIRGNNMGGGDGVYGNTSAAGKAGVRGEGNSASSYGVWGNNGNTYGTGIYGKADLGIGVQAVSQNGTALSAFSGTGYALDISGKVKIAGGNTNPSAGAVLTSDANGNATWQQQAPPVGFKAFGIIDGFIELGDNIDVKVQFETQEYDLGSNFVSIAENGNLTQANAFYAPVNGLYHFDLSIRFGSKSFGVGNYDYSFAVTSIKVVRNGNTIEVARFDNFKPGIATTVRGSTDVLLNAGDKVYVTARQSNLTGVSMPIEGSTHGTVFSGHLVKKL